MADTEGKTVEAQFQDSLDALVNGFLARGVHLRDAATMLHQCESACREMLLQQFMQVQVQQHVALAIEAERARVAQLQDGARIAVRAAAAASKTPAKPRKRGAR